MALHLACDRGFVDVARDLLAAGCATAAQTKQGELSLHIAAAKGHAAVLSVLLENCPRDLLRVRNNFGQRPSEVCADVETSLLLNEVRCNSAASESACSEVGGGVDSYAG